MERGKTSGIQCGVQPAQAFVGRSAWKSSAEVSWHQGFDERSARIFVAWSPRHSWEIRDAEEIPEDPDSASKRQQWTTNDENSFDIEEYVEWFDSQDEYSAVNDSVRGPTGVFRPHCASAAHGPRAPARVDRTWTFGKGDFQHVCARGAGIHGDVLNVHTGTC